MGKVKLIGTAPNVGASGDNGPCVAALDCGAGRFWVADIDALRGDCRGK
jgi:hypothetical protein